MRVFFLIMVLCAVLTTHATAQEKGARCVTEKGWCWASPPGKPGDRCVCPNPSGSGTIPGKLR